MPAIPGDAPDPARRQRLVAAASALAVLLVIVPLLVPGLRPWPSVGADPGSSPKYPQRIAHQYWVPQAPASPGPMAAVAQVCAWDDRRPDGECGSELVASDGRRYALPEALDVAPPALSSDGRHLALLVGLDLHVRDLVRGTDVAVHRPTGRGLAGPLLWSPDGTRLALQQDAVAVVGADGSYRAVGPANAGQVGAPLDRVVGWFDDRTLAVVHTAPGVDGSLRRVDAGTGRPVGSVPLPGVRDDGTQLTWSLAPDGSRLARRVEDLGGDGVEIRSTTTGRVTSLRAAPPDTDDEPVAAWSGGEPAFWGPEGLQVAGVVRRPSPTEWSVTPGPVLVVAEPEVTSMSLASTEAGASWALWGTRSAWLSWWWKELALAAGSLALLAWWRAESARAEARPAPAPSRRDDAPDRGERWGRLRRRAAARAARRISPGAGPSRRG